MSSLQKYQEAFQKNRKEIFEDYFTFLRFESIATDPAYQSQTLSCAEWLREYLSKIGLDVQVWQTPGAPTLFATDTRAGKDKKTVLIYCHYDVQPVDPLNLWTSPPFEPTIRDGQVFARGAVDDKGQCFYTVAAIKTYLELNGSFPFNLKFIIEGEEESGSPNLFPLIREKKPELKADYLLIVDSGIQAPDAPAITLGCRGLVCMTLTLTETHFDLHSGSHGGVVYNPNRALVEILGKVHDENGHILIPGFYDDIVPLSAEDQSSIDFSFDEEDFKTRFGAVPKGREKGLSPLECAWLRPTFEVNGISGGYSGAGFKTVIPAKAMAKVSCRLVPNQDPLKIIDKVKTYLEKQVPPGLQFQIEVHPGMGRPFRTHPHSQLASILMQAYSEVFNKACTRILIGGSIPVSVDLAEVSEAEMILIGVGLPDDQIHAPDEHFGIDRFEKGFLILCRAFELFGNE